VNLSTPLLWWPGALAHVPIWPAARAGRLRKLEQKACLAPPPNTATGATACRFLLRVAESPPALLLATPLQSRPSARPVPAKPAAARPQASAPKHRAGPAQQRNTREPKSSSETRLNQNPTPGGQEEDGASIPVEFQYKNSILHGRSLTLDK